MYKVLRFSFPTYLYDMKYLFEYFVSNCVSIDCQENALLLEATCVHHLLRTRLCSP